MKLDYKKIIISASGAVLVLVASLTKSIKKRKMEKADEETAEKLLEKFLKLYKKGDTSECGIAFSDYINHELNSGNLPLYGFIKVLLCMHYKDDNDLDFKLFNKMWQNVKEKVYAHPDAQSEWYREAEDLYKDGFSRLKEAFKEGNTKKYESAMGILGYHCGLDYQDWFDFDVLVNHVVNEIKREKKGM